MALHLKGLDSLRAFAALLVVWSHIEIVKDMYKLPSLWKPYFPSAHFSVTLFFVLSGFLITFLLAKEQENHRVISLKKFYIRRILRIWPLYYLILFLSYFMIDSNVTTRTLLLCLFIFPNVPLALKSKWTGSPQVWSIGVEEQFYIIWPLLFSLVPEKRKLQSLIIFCIGITVFPYVFNYINVHTFHNEKLHSFVEKYFYFSKFNCMALGGIFGYSVAKKMEWIKAYYNNRKLVIAVMVFTFVMWCLNVSFYRFSDEVYSLFFVLLITGVSMNPYFNIDTKIMRFFGKISYGLYMYHWIVTILLVKPLLQFKNHYLFN